MSKAIYIPLTEGGVGNPGKEDRETRQGILGEMEDALVDHARGSGDSLGHKTCPIGFFLKSNRLSARTLSDDEGRPKAAKRIEGPIAGRGIAHQHSFG